MATLPAAWLALLLAAPADDFFESNVRPVLAGACVRCHGPDKASAGLRVDSRDALLKGGHTGPAVVPGKAADSLLVKAIRRHPDVSAMPPDKPLRPEAVAALEKWVSDGAHWPQQAAPVRSARHWAFEPVAKPKLRSVDAFFGAKPPADKLTLVRRATFDLTGLPPTPDEIDAFVRDTSPDAYERLIEKLLASPHYGEKWGRFWLDVVRYADTAGETADFPVADAWRYRNYVIASFNADKPYDQFLREQVAGDLLPATSDAQRDEFVTATGYLAISRRFGFDVSKDHFLTLEDTIDTLGKSVLGLTIACARCHDHKYDPISASDYYALYGFFESTRYPFPGCEKDKGAKDFVALKASPGTAYAVAEGAPHDAQIHLRGDPESRGAAVPRRFLQILGGQPLAANGGSGRLQLAGWLADAKNPLTARVMANRIWQGHFGVGLVATPNDFGTRGEKPTDPALLDFIASSFVDASWSMKAMHRLVMHSSAYKAAAFPRRRMTAEEIRDSLLAVSGDLDPSPGGPHPFPEAKSWGFTQHNPFKAVYDNSRRSVYGMSQRIQRHPFVALFDGPDPNASTPVRQTTTVPTQSLYFLNDPFVHARAESLAAKLRELPDDRARVERLCQLLFGRPARDRDHSAAAKFLAAGGTWPAWVRVLFASNEFIYID